VPEIEAGSLIYAIRNSMINQEAEFRKNVEIILEKIEKAFISVDPDIAECEQAFGTLTVTFNDRSRCILSSQPAIQQIWLALAAEGVAYHFNLMMADGASPKEWESSKEDPMKLPMKWMDDKGRGIELLSFLSDYLSRKVGQSIQL